MSCGFFTFILISISDQNCIYGDCENGYGGYAWDNGDKYEGDWKDGKMHGKGTFIYNHSLGELNEEYKHLKADFRDGKLDWSGRPATLDWSGLGDRYEGEYKDGMKHGEGTYTYCSYSDSDRREYSGEWKDDKMDGSGKLSFRDNSSYAGDWKDNKRHGKGLFLYGDGLYYIGQWENDEFIGEE